MDRYKLFREVYCWLDNGLATGTVSKVRTTEQTEFAYPMGRPVTVVEYEVQVEGVPFWFDEKQVSRSKATLTRRFKDG
jgi:hypothetical protein